MPPVTPVHPSSTLDPVDTDGAARVPAPRAPAPRPRTAAPDDAGLNPIAQARVRESATRNTAAAELFDAGRYEEAVALFAQALASCRSTLGGEHPDTLTVAGNLGVAYVQAGQRRKGTKLITSNVAARARVLGDSHPDTLTARNALAAAGDVMSAHRLLASTMNDAESTLGPDHEHTVALVECGEAAGLLRREI